MNQLAQLSARALAKGQPPPAFPEGMGEAHVVYMTAPFLEDFSQIEDYLRQAKYEEAAVGVEFGRAPSNPGGAYFIVLMFFPSLFQQFLLPEFQMDIVLNALNKIRLESGLRNIRLDKNLSEEAQKIGVIFLAEQEAWQRDKKRHLKPMTRFYITEKLEIIPETSQAMILTPRAKKAGLSIFLLKTAAFPRGVFLVTVVLE